MISQIKNYYQLVKPGIIVGNLVTATAGFFLASQGKFDPQLFGGMILGLSCIIGSGCVFNNYIDRDADKKMSRTQSRPLAKKQISLRHALIFALFLSFLGTVALSYFTNFFAIFMALLGLFIYAPVYSLSKYYTSYATLIGSIAGAVPAAVGYLSVSPRFDLPVLFLFLIVALWQMPHFYAIAIYRLKEYAAAGIPVLPIEKGVETTKKQILFYLIAYLIASSALTLYLGYPYLVVTLGCGLVWVGIAIHGFQTKKHGLWARRVFRFSLVMIMIQSGMICLSFLI